MTCWRGNSSHIVPILVPVSSRAASAGDMPHRVTNVGDKSFIVTWLTDITETGYQKHETSASSLDNTAHDDRGQPIFTSPAYLSLYSRGFDNLFEPFHVVLAGRFKICKFVFHTKPIVRLCPKLVVRQKLNPFEIIS